MAIASGRNATLTARAAGGFGEDLPAPLQVARYGLVDHPADQAIRQLVSAASHGASVPVRPLASSAKGSGSPVDEPVGDALLVLGWMRSRETAPPDELLSVLERSWSDVVVTLGEDTPPFNEVLAIASGPEPQGCTLFNELAEGLRQSARVWKKTVRSQEELYGLWAKCHRQTLVLASASMLRPDAPAQLSTLDFIDRCPGPLLAVLPPAPFRREGLDRLLRNTFPSDCF